MITINGVCIDPIMDHLQKVSSEGVSLHTTTYGGNLEAEIKLIGEKIRVEVTDETTIQSVNQSIAEKLGEIARFNRDYNEALLKQFNIQIEPKKEVESSFLDYIQKARSKFVEAINRQEWDNELRMEAENILLAYDQMREHLYS